MATIDACYGVASVLLFDSRLAEHQMHKIQRKDHPLFPLLGLSRLLSVDDLLDLLLFFDHVNHVSVPSRLSVSKLVGQVREDCVERMG